MFTFAHLSDPHLTTLQEIPWSALCNKRILGYLSWKRHRREEHRPEVLHLLLHSLKQQKLDHIVVTGDLTHLGLPQEFQEARLWLDSLATIAEPTVIPGNHEAYVATSHETTLDQWEPYYRSDVDHTCQSPMASFQAFPSVRVRGPVAYIGLSSACPTVPFLATGTLDFQQLEKLHAILISPQLRNLFKVLLIHHPPLPGSIRWRKRLTNADQLHNLLSRQPVDLILHGHTHQCSLEFLDTPDHHIPIIGMPSASAKGKKPGYESQYCLFHLKKQAQTFQLSAALYSYIQEKEEFAFSRTLPLSS